MRAMQGRENIVQGNKEPGGGTGHRLELLIFSAMFVLLLTVLLLADAFDSFYAYSRAHENWELDEIVLAVCALGVTGVAFVTRRWAIERRDRLRIRKLSADLEKALLAARAADKAKSVFLANLSHELRTPLTAINGYAHLIESRIAGPLDDRYVGYARDVRESGEHLLALINDIIDLSRIEADLTRLELRPLRLQDQVAQSFKLLSGRATQADVALISDIPQGAPKLVADAQRLSQILINVICNAIKFSPPGGRVTVSAGWDEERVTIEVRDQGVGIDPKDFERALKPFSQVESGYSKSQEGLGLGLALVKRFVELHGGRLSLDSALGKGATVRIQLPLRPSTGPSPATPGGASTGGGN